MGFLLLVLAIILIVMGVIRLLQRDILWGVVLIIVGLLIGPWGYSLR